MAPEIAIDELSKVQRGSTVLDPMMGSGTVLRHAVQCGHNATGFDMDPLAVLMSRVWSTAVESEELFEALRMVDAVLPHVSPDVRLPWIDDEDETKRFTEFWFGERQRRDLRRLTFALHHLTDVGTLPQTVSNALKIALSRIIITKGSGASLAIDVSHSRPHKVVAESDYDVIGSFRNSTRQLSARLNLQPLSGQIKVGLGDARLLEQARSNTVDLVLTSPPYLNAIDYMRGHKLSLVWLGHTITALRSIRSNSIGAERRSDISVDADSLSIQAAMVDRSLLTSAQAGMIDRYSHDLIEIMKQISRVLKPEGKAILVVGNSCLRQVFIKNSDGVVASAELAGLEATNKSIRELPRRSRYLPMPLQENSSLGKRMRTEAVLTFVKAA